MNVDYDLAIIGAGPAGYTAAIRAGQLGMKVVLIDERKLPGGTCLNEGCIPTKSLLHSTLAYYQMHHMNQLGVICPDPCYDFMKMQGSKLEALQSLGRGVQGLLRQHHVTCIMSKASLLDPHTVYLESGQRIIAERILLATGSCAASWPDTPFDEEIVLSSKGALELQQVPRSLLIIGSGVVGLELGCIYQRLGCHVTLVDLATSIGSIFDEDMSQLLQGILERQGLTFFLGAKVQQLQVRPFAKVHIQCRDSNVKEIEAEKVLIAIGRAPLVQGLGLESLGVKLDAKSRIQVDKQFRTNEPSIYAVGDLIDGPMLAHKASEEARVAVECMAGLKSAVSYMTIPSVIYTHPEAAAVGITEKELESLDRTLLIGRSYMRHQARARCSFQEEGMVKWIADGKTKRILGLQIIATCASELIAQGVLAIQKKMTLEDLSQSIQPHPTFSEALKEAAFEALKSIKKHV